MGPSGVIWSRRLQRAGTLVESTGTLIATFAVQGTVARLRAAVQELRRRQPILRTSFDVARECQREHAVGAGSQDFPTLLHESHDNEPCGVVISSLQQALDLEHGLPFAVAIIPGSQRNLLCLLLHHLTFDYYSLALLADELETLTQDVTWPQGGVQAAPSYGAWTTHLHRAVHDGTFDQDAVFWREQLAGTRAPYLLSNAAASVRDQKFFDLQLDEPTTMAVTRGTVGRVTRGTPAQVVAACISSLSDWSGTSEHVVRFVGHGRHMVAGLEAPRTMGWCSGSYPLGLRATSASTQLEKTESAARGLLDVPSGGVSYGALTAYSDAFTDFPPEPRVSVRINHLGPLSSEADDPSLPFRLLPKNATASAVSETPPDLPIYSLLDVYSQVLGGRLTLRIGVDVSAAGPADAALIVDDIAMQLRRLAHEVRKLPSSSRT